jgi:hypothetical protein
MRMPPDVPPIEAVTPPSIAQWVLWALAPACLILGFALGALIL